MNITNNVDNVKVINTKSSGKSLGIVSVILGVISLVLSLMLFFHDISSVGMYTEIYERLFYAVNYVNS